MKHILILSGILFFSISAVFSQQGRPSNHPDDRPPREHFRGERGPGFPGEVDHEKREEAIISRLNEQIQLTASQENQIREILNETTAQIKIVEQKMKPELDQIKQEVEELRSRGLEREQMREEMRAIKDAHKDDMEQFKTEMRQLRMDSKSKINSVLTTEQKARLYELRDKYSEWGKNEKQNDKEKIKRGKSQRKN